jgi:hypothetical protein
MDGRNGLVWYGVCYGVLYGMVWHEIVWYIQYCSHHERSCCIGYTKSSRRQEFIYPIQHNDSTECCKRLVKRLDENIRTLQQFKING